MLTNYLAAATAAEATDDCGNGLWQYALQAACDASLSAQEDADFR